MKSNLAAARNQEDVVVKPPSMLGVRMRHARLVAGLTMTQVAQKSQCSESLISKIETGQASPSLAMLHRIAVTLDTNIATLTTEEAPKEGPILLNGERPVIKAGGISLERITLPKRGGLLQANIHIIPPGEASDGLIEHVGEEVGFVLEGSLELMLGSECHLIQAGDAFNLSSQTPHGYRNVGKVTARIFWVNTPATF
ncbi:MAG: cupin domain-containing protein [Polaromonas sp.]|uniref:helix-turn-helix domain-containing protein n=1 Tax=Polaromonas sp. TaxID=1869339 RepID=UPI00182130D2|nr:XRE family transcriptional regulator [Polaromonas sp.]NMM10799.1 cupin domain-containing protein [Polaromonas sp.]